MIANVAPAALLNVSTTDFNTLFVEGANGQPVRTGDRIAFMYSPIVTAKMNDIDPQTWLADVLARIPASTVSRLPELLPWNWRDTPSKQKAA